MAVIWPFAAQFFATFKSYEWWFRFKTLKNPSNGSVVHVLRVTEIIRVVGVSACREIGGTSREIKPHLAKKFGG